MRQSSPHRPIITRIQAPMVERHDRAPGCYQGAVPCQLPHSLTANDSTKRLGGS
jgi:hypothetical protein